MPEITDSPEHFRLKPLHPDVLLSSPKLAEMERIPTEVLLNSLLPGQKNCLKARPDGTMLDGHHRISVLRGRGVAVDSLPRETIEREDT
jgi:hypothetical protein